MDVLQQTDHRPWPLPQQPWMMTQTWQKLLFLHWAVDRKCIESLIPAPLELDTFSGQAWITILPFEMKQMRLRLLPPLPYAHTWYECNVRTYVTYQGRPGVFFLTLDANHWLGGQVAKAMWDLPYRYVQIDWQEDEQQVHFYSFDQKQSLFQVSYQPTLGSQLTQPGTLDHWLLERYALFSKRDSQLYCGEIHHLPWMVQEANVEIKQNWLLKEFSIPVSNDLPRIQFADHKQMWAWMPVKLHS